MLRWLVRALAFFAIIALTMAMATVGLSLYEGASALRGLDIDSGSARLDELILQGLRVIEQAGPVGALVAWLVGIAVILIVRGILLSIIAIVGALTPSVRTAPPPRPRVPEPSRPAPVEASTGSQPGPWSRQPAPTARPMPTVRDVRPPDALARPTSGTPHPRAEKPVRPSGKAHPTTMPLTTKIPLVERPMRFGRLFEAGQGVVLQRPRGHVER